MRRVIVHIDRLVLTGFRREDRDAVGAGLQQELARAFADPAALARLASIGDMPRLQVDGVQLGHGAAPQRAGEELARGIDKGIGQ
jgi:hypothetical protein